MDRGIIYNAKMKLYLFIFICLSSTSSIGQTFSSLQTILQQKYPENVSNNEEWIFYKEKANFEKTNNPLLKKYFSNYDLYAVDLSFKSRPDWICRCVVFFDSVTTDFILQGPLTMNYIDPKLLSLTKTLIFKDRSSLFTFINEFHKLRQIGSKCKFFQTNISDTLISYDVVFLNDQDYITRPYHNTTQEKYDSSQIIARVYIKLESNRIKDYLELSPKQTLR